MDFFDNRTDTEKELDAFNNRKSDGYFYSEADNTEDYFSAKSEEEIRREYEQRVATEKAEAEKRRTETRLLVEEAKRREELERK
jgi:hypothetical protein